jgi:hypothetical protein
MAKERGLPIKGIPVFPRRLFSQSQMWVHRADCQRSENINTHFARRDTKSRGLIIRSDAILKCPTWQTQALLHD